MYTEVKEKIKKEFPMDAMLLISIFVLMRIVLPLGVLLLVGTLIQRRQRMHV
jgi:hypothetical protein